MSFRDTAMKLVFPNEACELATEASCNVSDCLEQRKLNLCS